MNNDLRTKLDQNGRVVIPVAFRKALGVKPGGEVFLRLDGGELRITTQQARIRRSQLRAERYLRGDGSAVRSTAAGAPARSSRSRVTRSSMPACGSK